MSEPTGTTNDLIGWAIVIMVLLVAFMAFVLFVLPRIGS